jgi:hypothetical protein
MDDAGIVTAIWYILWPLGIFYGDLVIFPRFGMLVQGKIWQPCVTWKNACRFFKAQRQVLI